MVACAYSCFGWACEARCGGVVAGQHAAHKIIRMTIYGRGMVGVSIICGFIAAAQPAGSMTTKNLLT